MGYLNQSDHDNESWWDLSRDWPSTDVHAYEKWVFANKSKIIPYGSYVISDNMLRVSDKDLLNKLNENFNILRNVIIEKYNEEGK